MARTKRTARKSRGGKAPRKQLSAATGRDAHKFHDHAGQVFTVLCTLSSSRKSVPKLGIQLYLLGNRPGPEIESLARNFVHSDAIGGWGNASNYWPRVDAYSGFKTVEECIGHHRKEKEFRKNAVEIMRRDAVAGLSEDAAKAKLLNEIRGREPLPHIVPSWCPSEAFWNEGDYNDDRYRSWIIVIPEDRLCWEDVVERGLVQVRFDLDVTPQMLTESWWEGVDDDTCLDKDTDGWVYVDWSENGKRTPVDSRLLCVRNEPHRYLVPTITDPEQIAKIMYGWETPETATRLAHVWSSYTGRLRDCTYRPQSCDSCYAEEDHESCESDLDEHYFDGDGQCIACRRAIEYRRRSNRIATQGKRPKYF